MKKITNGYCCVNYYTVQFICNNQTTQHTFFLSWNKSSVIESCPFPHQLSSWPITAVWKGGWRLLWYFVIALLIKQKILNHHHNSNVLLLRLRCNRVLREQRRRRTPREGTRTRGSKEVSQVFKQIKHTIFTLVHNNQHVLINLENETFHLSL